MPFQITVEKPHQQKLTRNGDKGRDSNDDLKTSLLLIPINSIENRTENKTREQKLNKRTTQNSTVQIRTAHYSTWQYRIGEDRKGEGEDMKG